MGKKRTGHLGDSRGGRGNEREDFSITRFKKFTEIILSSIKINGNGRAEYDEVFNRMFKISQEDFENYKLGPKFEQELNGKDSTTEQNIF